MLADGELEPGHRAQQELIRIELERAMAARIDQRPVGYLPTKRCLQIRVQAHGVQRVKVREEQYACRGGDLWHPPTAAESANAGSGVQSEYREHTHQEVRIAMHGNSVGNAVRHPCGGIGDKTDRGRLGNERAPD